MKFQSTRGTDRVSLSDALRRGIAPDGGLYVPEYFPKFATGDADETAFQELARMALAPFFEGDELEHRLGAIVDEAFDFPVPLVDLGQTTSLLELFHGPSAAFKDFGARFLASAMTRLESGEAKPLTILVATSGDTGGAVASAFWRKPGIDVVVLYPDGKVSARQAHQLACWGDNVRTFAVEGVFDDCQRMVKEAFASEAWNNAFRLSSANSINIGRLLPQMTYYAASSLWYQARHGVAPGFVIPSGNVGNATAAVWAREMGFPVREIVFATNANQPLVRWLQTGVYAPEPSIATLANAMDVGAPSNMERLLHLHAAPTDWMRGVSVSDDAIRATIAAGEETWDQVFCPHTACAMAARQHVGGEHWICVSTAHPAKFDTVVEPLVGHPVAVPAALGALLQRPANATTIPAELSMLWEQLTHH